MKKKDKERENLLFCIGVGLILFFGLYGVFVGSCWLFMVFDAGLHALNLK